MSDIKNKLKKINKKKKRKKILIMCTVFKKVETDKNWIKNSTMFLYSVFAVLLAVKNRFVHDHLKY